MGFDGRPRSDGPKHKATCTQCGSECEVPFEPKEGRPVYCNGCFSQVRKSRR